jgi:uncharacterized protein (TIGR02594 family)
MSTYTVRPGDTLSKIAKTFATTVVDIQAANKIPDPDLILIGQKLVIPGVRTTTSDDEINADRFDVVYVVRRGDTLSRIAKSQGVSLHELLRNNPDIADPDVISVGQLISVPNGLETTGGVVSRVVPPPEKEGEPSWLAFAAKELESDVVEIGGRGHNPRILEYHATTSLGANRDETPWCSSFVNWCFAQAGIRGTNRANARSWLDWGVPLTEPKLGAVAIFWRGKRNDSKTGHVGFFIEDDGPTVQLLGGNQGNRVSVKNQTMKKFLGFRYPE